MIPKPLRQNDFPPQGGNPSINKSISENGQYIVVFKPDTPMGSISRTFRSNQAYQIKKVYQQCLKGMLIQSRSRQTLDHLRSHPQVESIEPDGLLKSMETQESPPWHLDRIDQRNLPLNNTYTYQQTGSGVHVYVMDTGINVGHVQFNGRAVQGVNLIPDGHEALDCDGHGTHVAGLIGSQRYGVAKECTLIAIRILNSEGEGTTSTAIEGIEWLAQNVQFPAVVNMSLGGSASNALDQAIVNSVEMGITYVVAAGNSSANACNFSPARSPQVITVGSSQSNDQGSSFSNYGQCVDLIAPGSSTPSCWHTTLEEIRTLSGTSMSSAIVTGVVALYLEDHPEATPDEVKQVLIDSSTKDVLNQIGTDTPNRLLCTLFQDQVEPPPLPPPEEEPPCLDCFKYTGTLTGSGDYQYQPNNTYYYSSILGTHRGWLKGPSGADFDLYLWKWISNRWTTVASSTATDTSNEQITYQGTTGYYTWVIYDYSGSGDYTFWLQKP